MGKPAEEIDPEDEKKKCSASWTRTTSSGVQTYGSGPCRCGAIAAPTDLKDVSSGDATWAEVKREPAGEQPSQWDELTQDKQAMQEEQPLQVAARSVLQSSLCTRTTNGTSST